MTTMTLGLILGAILMAAAGAMIFVFAVRKGAFDDLEEVKFQIFREEDTDEKSQL